MRFRPPKGAIAASGAQANELDHNNKYDWPIRTSCVLDLVEETLTMTPTPAQVEAAAKVINEIYDEGMPPSGVVMKTARDALTAAAEAGPIDGPGGTAAADEVVKKDEEVARMPSEMMAKYREQHTAAAEVGPVGYKGSHSRGESDPSVRPDYPTGSPFNPDGSDYHILNAIEDIQAAAEVGHTREDQLVIAAAEAHVEVMQQAVAAERERCAQVAEAFPAGMDRIKAVIAREIAAAIRAQKDKP